MKKHVTTLQEKETHKKEGRFFTHHGKNGKTRNRVFPRMEQQPKIAV
jgi:hypothetical protein